jgi:hypothetical protein
MNHPQDRAAPSPVHQPGAVRAWVLLARRFQIVASRVHADGDLVAGLAHARLGLELLFAGSSDLAGAGYSPKGRFNGSAEALITNQGVVVAMGRSLRNRFANDVLTNPGGAGP